MTEQQTYETTLLRYDKITLDTLPKLAVEIGFKYDDHIQQGLENLYVFILDSDDVTVGRLTFKNGVLHYMKDYRRHDRRVIDESDYIFMRLAKFQKDGTLIHQDLYDQMVEEAKRMVEQDYRDKLQWREDHPKQGVDVDAWGRETPKRRKKIQGRNPRMVLNDIIMNYDWGF